jgi:hypothetical protein
MGTPGSPRQTTRKSTQPVSLLADRLMENSVHMAIPSDGKLGILRMTVGGPMKARYVILSAVVGVVLALGFHSGNGGADSGRHASSGSGSVMQSTAASPRSSAVSQPRRSVPRPSAPATKPSVPSSSHPSALAISTKASPGISGGGWLVGLMCCISLVVAAATVVITVRGIGRSKATGAQRWGR